MAVLPLGTRVEGWRLRGIMRHRRDDVHADASAVEMMRHPIGLARALRAILDDQEVREVAEPGDPAPGHRESGKQLRGA